MTATPDADDPRFADLLDDLLTAMLDGDEPDRAAIAARHPAVADRIDEALELAFGVPGRRQAPRPSLQGYEILREIGRGGMGTVYLARQLALDRVVALKVLPHSIGLSPRSRPRFLAEARALAKVEHEHIVAIHRIVDAGEVLAFEMEYVDGPSLQQLLDHLRAHREATGAAPTLQQVAERLQLPLAELGARHLMQFFVRLLAKVAAALGAVHQASLIHRDVKPANILLRRNGQPVLVDFGLVRLTGREISRSGSFAGTPAYSAPEQLRGDTDIGPTADVYGLGVTLYECLTLATPFAGRTTTDQLRRIEEGRCPPLRRVAPGVPRDLETIVARAMEVDAARRYPHASAVADDLQRLLDLQPIQARPVGRARRFAKFLRRNRTSLVAGALGAALVVIGMVPVLEHVQAAGRHRDDARQLVQSARQRLFATDGRRARPTLRSATTGSAPLLAAVGDYERALALDPDNAIARRECAITRLALWLRRLSVTDPNVLDRTLDSSEFRDLCAPLGPVVAANARRLALGSKATAPTDEPTGPTATTDDEQRIAIGLLGFLVGDSRLCESAWQGLSPLQRDEPLVSAVLGTIHLNDGMPDLAYAHLQQAQRAFPTAALLPVQLADAALAMGDLALARFWLERIGDDPDIALQRQRLELDLQAAGDVPSDPTARYEELARLDPGDPVPRHRLALLAQRRGDYDEAARRLDALVCDWPEDARFRLDRARLALQRRDVGGYARQALAVLASDFGRGRSRGTVADLLEILRIGGLGELYQEGLAATGAVATGRGFVGGEWPIRTLLPAQAAAQFEALLRAFHDVGRQTAAMQGDARVLPDPAVVLLVGVPLFLTRVNGLTQGLQPGARLSIASLPWIARQGYPYLFPFLRDAYVGWAGGWAYVSLLNVPPPADLAPDLAFGNCLRSIPDCNGDGRDDVLIGCANENAAVATGMVQVADGLTGATIAVLHGDMPTHLFGFSLAAIGDIDGDGQCDWLIGAPSGTAAAPRGAAEIWSGATRQRLHRIDNDGPGFGVATTGLGDTDGDGVPDFAVANAPILRNSAAQGSVQIFSGRTRAVLHTLRNDVTGVWYGGAIDNVGDADGDGVCDLAVGGNYGNAPGLVRLYSGRTGALLQSWSDANPDTGFGTVVVGPGDLDHDGCGDVLVTSVSRNLVSIDQVSVFSGATGKRLATVSADKPGTAFGAAVSRYRQADGSLWIAIGAAKGGPSSTGSVEFWAVDRGLVSTLQGPGPLSRFGTAIATVPDSDGDGRPELFIAAPLVGPSGAVYRIESRQVNFGF